MVVHVQGSEMGSAAPSSSTVHSLADASVSVSVRGSMVCSKPTHQPQTHWLSRKDTDQYYHSALVSACQAFHCLLDAICPLDPSASVKRGARARVAPLIRGTRLRCTRVRRLLLARAERLRRSDMPLVRDVRVRREVTLGRREQAVNEVRRAEGFGEVVPRRGVEHLSVDRMSNFKERWC